MGSTYMVTGATGFLGKEIAATLERKASVVGCGHSQSLQGQQVDLREPGAVSALVQAVSPDAVVHAAAYREPDFCEANPDEARRLNVGSVQNLCESLPTNTYLIFISTDYVFDGETPPYREESQRNPINVYGQTKCEAEDIIAARANAISLRIPVLVGAGTSLDTSGYIGQLIRTVRDTTPTTQDHFHVRYPTWIRDVSYAVDFLIEKRPEGVVQFCGDTGATRYDSALETARILGLPSDHISPQKTSTPRGARRPLNSALSTEKIRAMGFTGFTPFADVVQHVLDRCPE